MSTHEDTGGKLVVRCSRLSDPVDRQQPTLRDHHEVRAVG
jgi:hypothetical protein